MFATVSNHNPYICKFRNLFAVGVEVCNKRWYLSCHMTKPTKWRVRPAMTQIRLGIGPVWTVFSVHKKKHWALNYLLSAQLRLWSFCWFCRAAAHFETASVYGLWKTTEFFVCKNICFDACDANCQIRLSKLPEFILPKKLLSQKCTFISLLQVFTLFD